jgi:hypothetical protein
MNPHRSISKPRRARRLAACLAVLAAIATFAAQPTAAQLTSATKDLLKCQKAIGAEGMKVVALEQKSLEKCYEPLLKCELMAVQGEHRSPEAQAKCFTKAAAGCEKAAAKIAAARDKRHVKLLDKCAAVAIADVQAADGLGWGLMPCGAETTRAGFVGCLDQVLQPKTEIVTGQLAARIGNLLDAQGLGDPFPNLPRP